MGAGCTSTDALQHAMCFHPMTWPALGPQPARVQCTQQLTEANPTEKWARHDTQLLMHVGDRLPPNPTPCHSALCPLAGRAPPHCTPAPPLHTYLAQRRFQACKVGRSRSLLPGGRSQQSRGCRSWSPRPTLGTHPHRPCTGWRPGRWQRCFHRTPCTRRSHPCPGRCRWGS